ncbi:MAG: NADPH:quinone oxidoreductase family protein [Chlorobiales bacterium]|jgi:NADPH:quinone reductase|nr:NADPH:quinone oxidoreductase family protein [Chlorobiales bacterium]
MKKILVDFSGALTLTEVPPPVLHDNDVQIKVQAIGVNFADIKIRNGYYLKNPGKPTEMGTEISGIVERAGRDAHRFNVGDKVIAVWHWGGGYAETVCVPEFSVHRMPVHLSFEQGAAFVVTFQTAYHALKTTANIQPGETVLIHSAGGGVGTAAVQLAKLFGAKVFAAASSPEKLERLKRLGADVGINYSDGNVKEVVMQHTQGKGVDCILDGNGGPNFERNLDLATLRGKIVLYGNSAGPIPPLDPYRLVYSSQQILGFSMRSITAHPELLEQSYNDIIGWIEAGKIKAEVGHVLSLADADMAHRLMLERKNYGKIVLIP